MQRQSLWTDRLLADRSTSLFRALYARELGLEEYDRLIAEVMDPEMAFFLRNSHSSLSFSEGYS